MNTQLLHDATFYILYGCIALALFIAIERGLFFAYTRRQARHLAEALIQREVQQSGRLPAALAERPGLPVNMIEPILAQRGRLDHQALEDLVDTQYLATRAPLARSLWIIETITTAAPLLGLLGTILGIIDTFKALASAGVSDPGQISGGIGTALFATGLGIAVALLCVVFHNFFQDRQERINEQLKIVLIRARGAASSPAQAELAEDLSPARLRQA
ncbi:MotA/TolQ/ExbB proton channel family protein [Pseudomonas sp. LA5]|uniref:MotA/TolQ/ExbB proton channel family protein n=1 Tax=Pseudomonas sp. LA5 TaxID=3027850 RepID=UPI0023618B41|nr:MotA/TolQ/ExbB proton channel family protein [Pseudomonas sp. LA5]